MNNRVDIPFNINTPTSERKGLQIEEENLDIEIILLIPSPFIFNGRNDFSNYQSILNRSLNDNELRKNNNINTNLKTIQNKKENCQCSICFEKIDLNENLFDLNCGHDFHESCLNNWIKYKQDCPVCRKSVPFIIKK